MHEYCNIDNKKNMRNIIVHSHLFKNAGTTLDWSLKRCFGQAFLDHREDDKMCEGAKYLGSFLLEHEELKALSSHHIRFPLPDLSGITLFPIIMLRHPVDRVESVYSFEKRQKANTAGAIYAKDFSFQEYVKWRMMPESSITIRNFQTSMCLDVPDNIFKGHITRPIAEADFKSSLGRLKRTMLLGVVDLYDESMVLFEEFLRPFFHNIDCSYMRQNVTAGRKKTLEDRVFDIFQQLGLEINDSMLVHNHWDLKLYRACREIVLERIEKVENFDKKLKNFRKRCLELQ